jgi:hypothetical protein
MGKRYIILLLSMCIISLSGCRAGDEIASQDIEKNIGPDEIIEQLTMMSTIGGDVEWQMKATLAHRYNTDRRWIAYHVDMETLNQDDKSFYRSDSVYVHEIQDEIVGMGNVVLISERGILKTNLVTWHRLTDRIHAPGNFYIVRDDHEMWGENLITNSSLDFIDAQRVSGRGTLDPEELKMFD